MQEVLKDKKNKWKENNCFSQVNKINITNKILHSSDLKILPLYLYFVKFCIICGILGVI